MLKRLCKQLHIRLHIDFDVNEKIGVTGSYDHVTKFARQVRSYLKPTPNSVEEKPNEGVSESRLAATVSRRRSELEKFKFLPKDRESNDKAHANPSFESEGFQQPPQTPSAALATPDKSEESAVYTAESLQHVAPPFQVNSLTVEYVKKVCCHELRGIERQYGVSILESIDSSSGTSMVTVQLSSGEKGTSAKAVEEGYRELRTLCTDVTQLQFSEKKILIPSGRNRLVDDLLKTSLNPTATRTLIDVNDQTNEISLLGIEQDVERTAEQLSSVFKTGAIKSLIPSDAADEKYKEGEQSRKRLRYVTKRGNIAKENVDLIICGINADLILKGAAKAVCKAGGKHLETQCKELLQRSAQPRLGKVFMTAVKDQPYQFVFFAVIHEGKGKQPLKTAVGPGESLANIFYDCLEKTMEVGAKSIAVPALGCGAVGLKKEECVQALLSTVDTFLETVGAKSSLEEVVFIDTNDSVHQEFVDQLKIREQVKLASKSASSADTPNYDNKTERCSNLTSGLPVSGIFDIFLYSTTAKLMLFYRYLYCSGFRFKTF